MYNYICYQKLNFFIHLFLIKNWWLSVTEASVDKSPLSSHDTPDIPGGGEPHPGLHPGHLPGRGQTSGGGRGQPGRAAPAWQHQRRRQQRLSTWLRVGLLETGLRQILRLREGFKYSCSVTSWIFPLSEWVGYCLSTKENDVM